MKIYEKPDVEYVALVSKEEIANGDLVDGIMGLASSIF